MLEGLFEFKMVGDVLSEHVPLFDKIKDCRICFLVLGAVLLRVVMGFSMLTILRVLVI